MIDSSFLCNVIIQVTLIFIFLTVFFFTYAKNKEADVVVNNVDFLISSFLGDGKVGFINEADRKELKDKLLEEKEDNHEMLESDQNVERSNKEIISKSIKTVRKVTVVVILIVLFCFLMNKYGIMESFFKKIDFKDIFKESIIILFFVALTEFFFLNAIGVKYISIEPTKIKAQLIQNLYDYSKS